MEDFHQISITGRYIYCYLCLRNAAKSKGLENIPGFLDAILKTFTSSSRLDDWQSEVDEVRPSIVLDKEKDRNYYKLNSYEQVSELRNYYLKNTLVADIVENLIWLGISQLYVGFNSDSSFEYVQDIIDLLKDNKVELPNFSIISNCSVNVSNGWGNSVDMDIFL